MTNPKMSGQDLLDDLRIELGGLSNAFTVDQLLSFINKGKDEVWSVIRSLDLDYFGDNTQTTDNTKDSYFANLVVNQREYTLPINCREPRFIECLSSGFQDRIFEYRKFDDPVFATARRESTAFGPTTQNDSGSVLGRYYYTIFGSNQLILAQFPEAPLQVVLWYIKAVDDIAVDTEVTEILHPFNKKIVDYAATRAILTTQNQMMTEAWASEWKESIKTLALSAGPRTSTNPIFIQDYYGSE
jgi:hypothetical protein